MRSSAWMVSPATCTTDQPEQQDERRPPRQAARQEAAEQAALARAGRVEAGRAQAFSTVVAST
jgi:hypothetical protein